MGICKAKFLDSDYVKNNNFLKFYWDLLMLESLENFVRRKLREENNLSEIKNLLYAKANKSNKK